MARGPSLVESCHAKWLHCIVAQWLTASGTGRQTVAPLLLLLLLLFIINTSFELRQVNTGTSALLYSVRLRNAGVDRRGFVQLPTVIDDDGNVSRFPVDPLVLSAAACCYVDGCPRATHLEHRSDCVHIRAALECRGETEPLPINPSVVDSLAVADTIQDPQGVSASEMTYVVSGGELNSTHSLTHTLRHFVGASDAVVCPLVQRATRSVFVVRSSCESTSLEFVHVTFAESVRQRIADDLVAAFTCDCIMVCDVVSCWWRGLRFYCCPKMLLQLQLVVLYMLYDYVLYNRGYNISQLSLPFHGVCKWWRPLNDRRDQHMWFYARSVCDTKALLQLWLMALSVLCVSFWLANLPWPMSDPSRQVTTFWIRCLHSWSVTLCWWRRDRLADDVF